MKQIEEHLNAEQLKIWDSLDNPYKIQAFLDQIPYSTDDFNRCPLRVMQDQYANCFDGALLAAAALRRLGFPPLILDMLPEPDTDDDHILAIYKVNGCYGAVAKSNFACLRFREPVYRSLRELVISYFDWFYNSSGQKTLRAYNRPLHLAAFDRFEWVTNDECVSLIEQRLYQLKPIPIISVEMAQHLYPMDDLTYRAGMLGVNPEGLYTPSKT